MDHINYQRLSEGNDFTLGQFQITGAKLRGYFLEPAGPPLHGVACTPHLVVAWRVPERSLWLRSTSTEAR